MPAKDSRERAVKYGAPHKALRRLWQVRINLGGVRCARCGALIPPGRSRAWDLGHSDVNPRRYNGPECRTCNRREGARKGNGAAPAEPTRSRNW